MGRDVLKSALKSASFNVLFQIVLRLITFLLNAFVLRYVTQDVVGVMNVRLLLLESTILFLSREAFRRAALSQEHSHSWQQIINLVWLTVPLSVIVSVIFSLIWLHILTVPSHDITPHYNIGVWSISISCVIEMLTEPLYIVSQAYSFIKLKIVLASIVVLVRTLIFVPWIINNPHNAVLAFSVSQILANLLYCLGFYGFYYEYTKENSKIKLLITKDVQYCNTIQRKKENENSGSEVEFSSDNTKLVQDHHAQSKTATAGHENLIEDETFPFTCISDFFPKLTKNKKWIHPNFANLTWSFLKQGVLKQILTEGERYVMTLFSVMSFKEQGIYDVVNNLGSLIVRFLFRPVEEALYFYFTQSLERDTNIKKQNMAKMKEVSTVLHFSLSFFIDIGLVIFTFGQSYSTLLLYLYGGERMISSQGPTLLQAHTFSVILLGINGVTEAYTFSAMTAHELDRYNYKLACFSVLFLIISWTFTRLFGGIGFIWANCCNMAARIFYGFLFINGRYSKTELQPLYGLMPNKYFFCSLCISFVVTKISQNYCSSLNHFLVGAICFCIVILVWMYESYELLNTALQKWRSTVSKNK